MVRDRTRELEKAQEELVKREKLAVLGQFTATVSHELRNPLRVIRSSNFYLQRKVHQKNEKIEKHFRRIEEQVGLCDSIVADLLEYTRGRHVGTVRRSLTAWLEPLLDELFEQEKITLARDISASLSIPHDQEKMRRVIINVMNNAIQATQARQQNWRDKEKSYDPEIFIGLRSEDSGTIIAIKDNGTGMDQETLKRAFEPLFTARARGTGLGLANVEKIISEHQGRIVLESEPDHGTRVTIFLPDRATNHC